MVRHALLSGANVTNDQMNYQVNCSLDAQLRVEIVVNARTDLCMLAFVEEFSGLVGQDNLFKRSLLLIRAWWVYETASYMGCPIKHYLSDFSLCIMVCDLQPVPRADRQSAAGAVSVPNGVPGLRRIHARHHAAGDCVFCS